jgi:hypothetical protein
MDGRHALKMACSSGHPSQTDNYLDTKKHPKNYFVRTLRLRKKPAGSGPRQAKPWNTLPTIKFFSVLD